MYFITVFSIADMPLLASKRILRLYEDVIPVALYDNAKSLEVLSFIRVLPISRNDKVTIFIAWSSDVDYSYTINDLDLLRAS